MPVKGFSADFLRVIDGDTPEITLSVRMLAADTPEKISEESKTYSLFNKPLFLNKLKPQKEFDRELRAHLQKKLDTKNSVPNQNYWGIEATAKLSTIIGKALGKKRTKKIYIHFGKEIFDRYDRMLAYVSIYEKDRKKRKSTFNLEMIRLGYATNYFIYPNLIPEDCDDPLSSKNLALARKAAKEAIRKKRGIWKKSGGLILLPMEYRFLERQELPTRFVGNMRKKTLHDPQDYWKIPVEDRIFFSPSDKDVPIERFGYKDKTSAGP